MKKLILVLLLAVATIGFAQTPTNPPPPAVAGCGTKGYLFSGSAGNGCDSGTGTGVISFAAHGAKAMGTPTVTAGTCTDPITASATGVATTDVIWANASVRPSTVSGYAPGQLYIDVWPTTDTVNFEICNDTSGDITPAALTMNWIVVRQ